MHTTEKVFTWKPEAEYPIEIELGRNCAVSKIQIEMEQKDTTKCQVQIRYAQNGVTSDLILFDGKRTDGEYHIDFQSVRAVSASHIYVELQDESIIRQIDVYEETGNVYEKEQEYEHVEADEGNIAFRKPVHTSSGKRLAQHLTDGSYNTFWQGEDYPAYIDIDLEKNYYLSKVEVAFPEQETVDYRMYTSLNGRDFAEYETGKEARILRIFIEYVSGNENPVIQQIRVMGEESHTAVLQRPRIEVPDIRETSYCRPIQPQDIYEEVWGIVDRRIGASYRNWFELELAENPRRGHGYDYFELTDANGTIHVKGNNGVSLATGIHHYLKHFCKVHISQVGDRVVMPKQVLPVQQAVFRETRAKVRYAYNYCTLSYTMAFYGRKEWRDELDWLALNGVNLVLDITGQEEVWRRFLSQIGYAHEDIKNFIAGPAYYAWAYMANMSGFGGPVHDSWFEERVALARENHRIMRTLGMQPVLQGYSGMIPNDIRDYDAEIEIINQGTWCGFQRPAMLRTVSDSFPKYAKRFYEIQKEVYGDVSHYYATDPFHEGGNSENMRPRDISRIVLSSMLEADAEAVWIIQSWQGNPSSELLAGLGEVSDGRKHALILDLYAEKTPHYENGAAGRKEHGYSREFDGTPWVFCMLNNFGGRLGMHGHLDNLASYVPKAFETGRYIVGIGITPEASENNPVLYDFFFETIWQENADAPMQEIALQKWLERYAVRRYGVESEQVAKAWEILKETVYKAQWNNLGQGAPECVANARPALEIRAASTWGNAVISYDMEQLRQARDLLLTAENLCKDSAGYQYDITTIRQQVLSNEALVCHEKMSLAFTEHQAEEFDRYARQFLGILDEMEEVTSKNPYYRLDRWLTQAEKLAEETDDFSRRLYVQNAKMLVTTWGSRVHADISGLHDYSNRQWSGLIKNFYQPRWKLWIEDRKKELNGEEFEKNPDWYEWEWKQIFGKYNT